MYTANHANRTIGIVILLLPFLSILGFLFGIPLGELDPFARDDVEDILKTIHDNREIFALSLGAFILQDALVGTAIAAAVYVAFRDRSRALSAVAAFGLIAAAACFFVHEVGLLTLALLATDYLEGRGPGGIPAGDPIILESARTMSLVQGSTALIAQVPMALGIGALGLLVGWAPAGASNPPRWLGYPGIIAAICFLATWSFYLNHTVGGLFTLAGEVAVMLMMVVLGIWFLRVPDSA